MDRDLDGLFASADAFGTDPLMSDHDVLIADVAHNPSPTQIPAQPHRGIATGPVLDIDRSNGNFNGRIHLTWVDANHTTFPTTPISDTDPSSFSNKYVSHAEQREILDNFIAKCPGANHQDSRRGQSRLVSPTNPSETIKAIFTYRDEFGFGNGNVRCVQVKNQYLNSCGYYCRAKGRYCLP